MNTIDKLRRITKSAKLGEFLRFVIVGVIATGIHYGVYLFILWIAKINQEDTIYANISYTVGYVVAWFCNFYMSAHFTFKTKTSVKRGVGFAVSHGINYLLHILFLNLFLWFGMSEKTAPIPVFVIVAPINFFLIRYVFTSKKFQR